MDSYIAFLADFLSRVVATVSTSKSAILSTCSPKVWYRTWADLVVICLVQDSLVFLFEMGFN